jgi:predicted dehydrogenase
MDKVRVGLVGAGGMANAVHYPSLALWDDVEMAALCDLVPDKLEATAQKFGIPKTYADYRQMLAEVDPQAVWVLMPPHHLFDIVIDCLEQKRHVFIEKPPGVTREQTRQMANLAAQNGCLTMVAFNRRYMPLVNQVMATVRERGPLLQCVSLFMKNYRSGPYYRGASDVLTCDAVHAVDMLRHMGGEVARLVSDVRAIGTEYENAFNALLKFESGACGFLQTNWTVGKRFHTFEMHADGISAFVNPDDRALVYADNNEEPTVLTTQQAAGSDESRVYLGFEAENRHFVDSIKTRREPLTCFADAVRTMELVERIYRAQI